MSGFFQVMYLSQRELVNSVSVSSIIIAFVLNKSSNKLSVKCILIYTGSKSVQWSKKKKKIK